MEKCGSLDGLLFNRVLTIFKSLRPFCLHVLPVADQLVIMRAIMTRPRNSPNKPVIMIHKLRMHFAAS